MTGISSVVTMAIRRVSGRRAIIAIVAATVLLGVATAAPEQARAESGPVWVNDITYGSPGGGYYHDFVSGQDWTAQRDWHTFSPVPARSTRIVLWVNYLTYGSAGGGFYLDNASGLVWTAERDWHAFSPSPVAPVVVAPKPQSLLPGSTFCRVDVACPWGPEQLVVGQPMRAMFILSLIPSQPVRAEAWWNGSKYLDIPFDPPPYWTTKFDTGSLLSAGTTGTIELRVYVGGAFIGSIGSPVVATPTFAPATPTPFFGGVATVAPTLAPNPTPYVPPSSGVRTGAICNDGWHSTATGSGACSYHGGVNHWLY